MYHPSPHALTANANKMANILPNTFTPFPRRQTKFHTHVKLTEPRFQSCGTASLSTWPFKNRAASSCTTRPTPCRKVLLSKLRVASAGKEIRHFQQQNNSSSLYWKTARIPSKMTLFCPVHGCLLTALHCLLLWTGTSATAALLTLTKERRQGHQFKQEKA
jgi:hypothetical protein